MRVYVAAKWDDKKATRAFMDRLVAAGHEITIDWTVFEGGLKEIPALKEDARRDLGGIEQCDIFIAIFKDPEYAYRGTFFQLGYAVGLRKRVIVVDAVESQEGAAVKFRRNAFLYIDGMALVKSEDKALEIVKRVSTE